MTNETGSSIAAVFEERGEQILRHWIAAVVATVGSRISGHEVERDLEPLLEALRRSVVSAERAGTRPEADDETRALLADLSRDRARQGFTPAETADSVLGIKGVLVEELGGYSALDQSFLDFSGYIDRLVLYTFESYVAAREELIADQADQLLDLSTPVVKLWDGVLAVPLVGTLDSARTQVVTEKLLQMLVDTGSEHAIIDITGVPAVDTQVAQHLLKTVMAARLMGARCIVSGIRPQIAQTIVTLGIEFGDIVTKATLADALIVALHSSGVDVVRRRADG